MVFNSPKFSSCSVLSALLVVSVLVLYIDALTFDDLKKAMRRNALEPSDNFIDERYQSVCHCRSDQPVGLISDLSPLVDGKVLFYSLPAKHRCQATNGTFPAYSFDTVTQGIDIVLCKDGYVQKDIDRCKDLFDEPGVPPTPPPPNDPRSCPENCLKEIRKIPKGEKGDRGEKGDKGERGDKGEQGPPGAPGGISGNAPSRVGNYNRTFSDLFNAYKRFSGCSMAKGMQKGNVWYDRRYPTQCKRHDQQGALVTTEDPVKRIDTGYVLFWYGDPWYYVSNYFAYRTDTDEVIPVRCFQEQSPIFLPTLKRDPKDIICPQPELESKMLPFVLNTIYASAIFGSLVYVYTLVSRFLFDQNFSEYVRFNLVRFFRYGYTVPQNVAAEDETAVLLTDNEIERVN